MRHFSGCLLSFITSKVLMLECPKTAQMKDFLKLFKTVMDFKGLSFIVTEQPFNKKLRPVFYFATVMQVKIESSLNLK